MKLQTIFIGILMLLQFQMKAQDTLSVIDGRLLEELLENNDEQNYDFLSLYEELQTYLKDPLNINKADESDFQGLNMLTDVQILDIIEHRNKFGDFISPYELQSIPSLDAGTLKAIIPLVGIGNSGQRRNLGKSLSEAQHNVFLKYKRVLEDKKGYGPDGAYLGSPDHYYVRYHMFAGQNLRIGATMEKDPGEEFFTGSNPNGFDYYSGFIYARDVTNRLKAINIGDYALSMGQGLIMHNSFGGGKSSYVMNVKKGGRPLRPYSSVNESNYFRGIAGTIEITPHIQSTLFYSRKKIDGSGIIKDTLIDTGFETFNTVNVSGFHRTESEIAKKRTVGQQDMGISIEYDRRSFHLGLNGLRTTFDKPIRKSDDLYKKFNFNGDELINTSLDYSFRHKNFSFFGEVSRSDNGGMAHLHGLLAGLGRNIDASVVFRDFGRDYQVLFANAFGESTLPINERGLYLGLRFKPSKAITLSAYADNWVHPWLRFRKDAPSKGKEYLFKIDYYKKRKFNLYLQYRYEQKEENGSSIDQGIDPIVDLGQHRVRLHFSYKLNNELEFRERAEYSYYAKEDLKSSGYLIYHDIIYKPIGRPLSFTARYALFDTDDFNSRIYAYENDILYEFSIPFYSGQGSRFYINTRYRVTRIITAEMHYGYVWYNHSAKDPSFDGIGSGNEFIDGNRRTDLKFQIKLKF